MLLYAMRCHDAMICRYYYYASYYYYATRVVPLFTLPLRALRRADMLAAAIRVAFRHMPCYATVAFAADAIYDAITPL